MLEAIFGRVRSHMFSRLHLTFVYRVYIEECTCYEAHESNACMRS